MMRITLMMLALTLSGCAALPEVEYKPATFADLPGWNTAAAEPTREAFAKSCEVMAKRDGHAAMHPQQPLFGTMADWHEVCALGAMVPPQQWGAFVEQNFSVYEIIAGSGNSLFTGYYEPSLKASLKQEGPYQHPIYGLPKDHVTGKLEEFFPNSPEFKGRQIVGRVEGQRFIPYFSRADIVEGALSPQDVLVWADDAVDVFFLHIQGSGRVTLPDGQVKHVGYAAPNGHAYVAVGKYLIDQGEVPKEEMSMQRIRSWLADNPARINEVLNQNPSYIFFNLRDEGPFGAQNVVLTPERSLAVDRRFTPYGSLVFVDTTLTGEANTAFQQLMVAQDTGGAIRGPVRGDIFFGYGERAEQLAGFQNAPGRLFVLIPKSPQPRS